MIQIFGSILHHTKLPADQEVDACLLLRICWRLLIFSACLQILEVAADVSTASSIYGLEFFTLLKLGGYALLLLMSFFSRLKWLAYLLVLLPAVIDLAGHYPSGANHSFLHSFSLLLATFGLLLEDRHAVAKLENLLDQKPEDQSSACQDALCAIRWLVAYVMLWSGLNKFFYGTYFRGEFFASMVNKDPRFARFFTLFVPQTELDAIIASEVGPFYFKGWMPRLMSNSVYVFEILAGVLLLIPKYVYAGVLLTFGILIMIEVVAVELVFGSLMVQLLLLYFPKRFINKGWLIPALFYWFLIVYHLLRIYNAVPDLGIF